MSEAPPHDAFVAAYRAGELTVQVDRERAARFVSGRMLLPFVLLPVLGIAVALALVGHWIIGALVFALTFAVRYLVRASSHGYVMFRALEDAHFYREALEARILRIVPRESA